MGLEEGRHKQKDLQGQCWPFCLELPTWNSLLSLRLLIDVRKDVNFMKSQSELAQKRNDPGREMQNLKKYPLILMFTVPLMSV